MPCGSGLPDKMDRTQITIATKEELDSIDAEYKSRAPIAEKLQTITYADAERLERKKRRLSS